MGELKPCPCGKIPSELHIIGEDRQKWQYVSGGCCSTWEIEFRSFYNPTGSEELMELAIEAWNNAPRGEGDDDNERA